MKWLSLFLLLIILSCGGEEFETIPAPPPIEIYDFPYDTRPDGENLKCKYSEYYRRKEYWSDKIKKNLRDYVTGSLTIQEQKELGETMHEKHLPFTLISHPKEALLHEMVEQMKPFLKNKAVIGEIFVVDDPTPNACTIVGGNIYVTTGLLDNIASDDALAYVIGHELGHNENNHTAENGRYIKKFMEYQVQYEHGGFLDKIKVLLKGLSLRGLLSATSCFGQTDELEADLAGLYLAYHAGYDPEAALDAIKQLKEWEQPMPSDDFDRFWQDLQRTHPWADDRYDCAASYLENYKITIRPDSIFPNGLDGMVSTKGGQLYIREYPNSPNIIDSLDNGEIVRMVCTSDYKDRKKGKGKWIYIKTDTEVMGWAWGGYLQIVKTKPKRRSWFSGCS